MSVFDTLMLNYDCVSRNLALAPRGRNEIPLVYNALSGMIAGIFAVSVIYPFDLVKRI